MNLKLPDNIHQPDGSYPLPPVEPAWEDMRRRLEEDDDSVPVVFSKPSAGSNAVRIGGAIVLLFLLGGVFLVRTLMRRNEQKKTTGLAITRPKTAGGILPRIGDAGNKMPAGKQPGENRIIRKVQHHASYKKNLEPDPANVPAAAQESPQVPSRETSSGVSFPVASSTKRQDSLTGKNDQLPATVDSSATAKPEEEQPVPARLQAGVQWHLPLPLHGTRQYFSGPDGSGEPYLQVLPSFWVSFRFDENRFSIEMNPFETMVLPDKPYASKFYQVDQLTSITENYTVHKTFGFSAGLRYDHLLKNKWWVGGTIENFWWKKANIRTDQITEKKNLPSDPSGTKTSSSFYGPLKDSSWVYFRKHQFKASAQLSYEEDLWQAGMRAGLFFIGFYNGGSNSAPLQAELFFRLKILDRPAKRQN